MALEQREMLSAQIQEQEQYEVHDKQRKIHRSRKFFSAGEKVLFLLFSTILVVFTSLIIHTEGQLNDINREVQKIGTEIDVTKKQNTELSIQVREKSTYEVVWEKAKALGLNLNDSNVKVVPGR